MKSPVRTLLQWCSALALLTAAANGWSLEVDRDDDPFLRGLHALVAAKMSEARSAAPLLDPLRIQPFTLTLSEDIGYLNVSLTKVSVSGLSRFSVRDAVTRPELLRTSALLRFPEVVVRAAYRLKGALPSRPLADQGLFEVALRHAHATWVGAIQLKEDGSSVASLRQEAFRTQWEAAPGGPAFFRSSAPRKHPLEGAEALLVAASHALLERVRLAAEAALEGAIAHAMGRASHASWFEMFPPTNETQAASDFELMEADTSPFVSVGGAEQSKRVEPMSEGRSRRRKRQVPCENGEGLDEYVDTLFRFGRRILRFREPIPFPNTTVKIDDMLTIFLYNGGVRGVSNLERRKNAYVKCTNTTITLGLVVRLQNLRVNVRYRVLQDYRLLLFNGDGDIRIREVIVLVQITQITNPDGSTMTRLDRLKIWKLGHVTVRLRGLGNLTSALSMLITRQVNEDPKAVIPVAEAQVTHVIRQELRNLTVPIFSLI